MAPSIDIAVIQKLNIVAAHTPAINEFLVFINGNELFNGALFMTIIWGLWFRKNNVLQHSESNRLTIISSLVGCIIGVLTTLTLTHLLPFRARPIYSPHLHLFPVPNTPVDLNAMNSFPSDHATLYIALATSLFFISKKLGISAMLFTLAVSCFPRLYLGLHYPSDILVGGLIGMGATFFTNLPIIKRSINKLILPWHQKAPALFYMGLYLITFEVGSLFSGLRMLLGAIHNML